MKKLIGPLAALALMAAALAVGVWAPWHSDTRERELAWLQALSRWLARAPGRGDAFYECKAHFDEVVGEAPSERLRPTVRIALGGCATAASDTGWLDIEWAVRSYLIDSRFDDSTTTPEPLLAAAIRDVAAGARVHCWLAEDWEPLAEEWGILARDEFFGLTGFADPPRHAIHLPRDACEPLRRFFAGSYMPYLNEESLTLAEALATLAHEGEHLRDPYASEAEVECYSRQEVRGIVREAGRRAGYANEMALLSWDLGYPHMPADYRTRYCRDGGRLDLHPKSRVWP